MGDVVLVCGGRDYADAKTLRRVLDALPPPSLVVSGGAQGADTLAEMWASSRGYPLVIFPANWTGEGKSAGFLRNERMLRIAAPDLIVAFPGGPGTRSMIRLGREAGVRVLDAEAEDMLS